MRILEIAFNSLFEDTKKLVVDGVRKDMANHISKALPLDGKRAVTSRGKRLRAAPNMVRSGYAGAGRRRVWRGHLVFVIQ